MADRPINPNNPTNVNRQQIYRDIETTMGLVPSFVKQIPDNSLEPEWNLMKKLEFEEGPVPHKYLSLIGLAIAAVTKSPHALYWHTDAAKNEGMTDEEIECAVHYAKFTNGWATYVAGLQVPFDEFKYECDRIAKHVASHLGNRQPVGRGGR